MITAFVAYAISNAVKVINSLKISDNHEDVKRQLNKLQKVFSAESLLKLMREAGQELKKEVLNRGNWTSSYDLSDYGQLLSYIASEEPVVAFNTEANTVMLGFGHIPSLNKIKRPADVGYIRDKITGEVREIHLKAGDFPYWIAAEFGILARGEDPPKHLGLPSRKQSTEYSPIRLDSLKPSGKPHYIMVKTSSRPPHPGVYPTRLFRRGLGAIYHKRYIEKKLREMLRRAATTD